jgi:hypothetical protein
LAEERISVQTFTFFAPADQLRYSFRMPLPDTIAVRFTEEDAGYVTVRPVVKQIFQLAELTDMVVSVTGKDATRVHQIFRAGTVVYNGYRYWWEGFPSDTAALAALLAIFPDDDPARPFDSSAVSSVSLEIGGGTQRSLISVTQKEAEAKRLFHTKSPWQILLKSAQESALHYEKYSHAQHADVYRLHLLPEAGLTLLKEMLEAAPRILRKKLSMPQPPAALLFFAPRKNS